MVSEVNKIPKDSFEKYRALYDEFQNESAKIETRINYIVRKICEMFGVHLEWYDFNNKDEYQNGHFDLDRYNEEVGIELHAKGSGHGLYGKLDGHDYDFSLGFPTRWIFEDFEVELSLCISAYKKEKEERELRKKTQKEEKEKLMTAQRQLANAAKGKLTPEELKALKASLYWRKNEEV